MGSPATKLAAETELAETMTEPTADAGRSVDRTLPGVGYSVALSSAPHPGGSATTGARTCVSDRDLEKRSEGTSHRSRSNIEESDVEVKQRFSTPAAESDSREYHSRISYRDNGDTEHVPYYTPMNSPSCRRRVFESPDGISFHAANVSGERYRSMTP